MRIEIFTYVFLICLLKRKSPPWNEKRDFCIHLLPFITDLKLQCLFLRFLKCVLVKIYVLNLLRNLLQNLSEIEFKNFFAYNVCSLFHLCHNFFSDSCLKAYSTPYPVPSIKNFRTFTSTPEHFIQRLEFQRD